MIVGSFFFRSIVKPFIFHAAILLYTYHFFLSGDPPLFPDIHGAFPIPIISLQIDFSRNIIVDQKIRFFSDSFMWNYLEI